MQAASPRLQTDRSRERDLQDLLLQNETLAEYSGTFRWSRRYAMEQAAIDRLPPAQKAERLAGENATRARSTVASLLALGRHFASTGKMAQQIETEARNFGSAQVEMAHAKTETHDKTDHLVGRSSSEFPEVCPRRCHSHWLHGLQHILRMLRMTDSDWKPDLGLRSPPSRRGNDPRKTSGGSRGRSHRPQFAKKHQTSRSLQRGAARNALCTISWPQICRCSQSIKFEKVFIVRVDQLLSWRVLAPLILGSFC